MSTYSQTLGIDLGWVGWDYDSLLHSSIDLKPQQEVTLRLYRQLLDPNNEPVLDNDKIWEEVRLMHQIEKEKNNVY